MLVVACLECHTAVRVIGDTDQVELLVGPLSEFWPNKYSCVSCGASCTGTLETEVEGAVLTRMKMRELTPDEMFAAQLGLGTPDEMLCDLATVREVFSTKKVKRAVGQTVSGTSRTCLHLLEFEDGSRMFFGSSSHGAIVYRISRPFSYVKKVTEEQP